MTTDEPRNLLHRTLGTGYAVGARVLGQNTWRLAAARRGRLPQGSVVVDLAGGTSGFSMLIDLPGRIEEDIASAGTYEPHIGWVATRLTPPGTCFVDGGANIGFHSLLVAASRPDVTVHAFEPHPVIVEQLRRNRSVNPHLANLHVHPVALGSERGSAALRVVSMGDHNRGLSSLVPNPDLADDVAQVQVDVVPLDDVLGTDTVGAIKLDVQGTECDALEGAVDLLARDRPVVVAEFVSSYTDDARAELDRLMAVLPDYRLFTLRPSPDPANPFLGPVLAPLDAGMVDDPDFWSDLLCLPAEHPW